MRALPSGGIGSGGVGAERVGVNGMNAVIGTTHTKGVNMKAKMIVESGTINQGEYFAIALDTPCPNSAQPIMLKISEFHYSQLKDPEALLSEIAALINKQKYEYHMLGCPARKGAPVCRCGNQRLG
jgi:hypothetical protein